MAIDQDYVSKIEPKFSAVDSDAATLLISIATLQVGSQWGDLQDYATALLVLHTWAMNKSGGKGNITHERVGDVERSYASKSSESKSGLDLTNWGIEFKRIGRFQYRGPIVT